MTKRKYALKQRAEQQAQTRDRIIKAMIALHEELGPRDTTISAIAERAGVQRLTVYRHFPDEHSLLSACSARWITLYPPPDSSQWAEVETPGKRCQIALSELYRYYRRTQRMWAKVYRDLNDLPALQEVMQGFNAYLDQAQQLLLKGWNPDSDTCLPLQATIAHCVQFLTWRSLSQAGLTDEEMAILAKQWIMGVLPIGSREQGTGDGMQGRENDEK
ncbi:TetR/AcrR family transcriptional regulator [Leptothermofonsia sichuanensis E412]|uniref:TetR/AcrR family transcriptional regulator n=1 Tax=Leptothermofonsia sichuanensis TaxID=2917832 RepID=UPI001CA74FE6|nr:TetR/AcrR family transcriptional regulator [Leptothermofonsia sichuanensis]QZZ23103.1 TetR/AcrR family transcriptional regulator [Leptothermofonsia sichuanensis E412]